MTVALFTAALVRPVWTAVLGLMTLAYGMTWQGLEWAEIVARGGVELMWLALVLAAANAWRQYGRWRAEHDARLLQMEQSRLVEQRLRISREVHDVVAHTLAVVGVHLNVAEEALDDSPEEAREALRTAMDVRNQAMADLKAFVGELRDAPQPGLESVPDLMSQARAAGLVVSYDVDGDPATVPAAQALTAYRVIQEAVVNTLRHSNARTLTVRVRIGDEGLDVQVTDDGQVTDYTPGHGLTGMRERVTALGGNLDIGTGGGFTVRAVLPGP